MSDTQSTAGVVELVDPEVPADQGLSSLGLLMQLAGNVFAALAALFGFSLMMAARGARGSDKIWLLVVLGLCVGRSLVQRMAGTELLYRNDVDGAVAAGPLAGIRRYVLVGLAQSVVVTGVMIGKTDLPAKLCIATGVGLALWPVVLAALLRLPRFRRFSRSVPVSEDKGFEGASILMTVLGLCGLLGSSAILLAAFDTGGRMLQQGPVVLLMLAVVMLVVRSGLHVQAGLSGLRETSLDRSVELANRYANFGGISGFCTGGALLLLLMTTTPEVSGLALVTGITWMLLAWPMIVRRFFSERQFADLLAGETAAVHRRAPDAGLTALGWLLLGHAAFTAALLVPQLVSGDMMMERGFGEMLKNLGPLNVRSAWWSVGIVGLQGWAGFELIRMGARHRVIATAYSIATAVLTVYLTWPVLKALGQLGHLGATGFAMFIPLAIQLVIPVATAILVNRSITPAARAQFRPRAHAGAPTV